LLDIEHSYNASCWQEGNRYLRIYPEIALWVLAKTHLADQIGGPYSFHPLHLLAEIGNQPLQKDGSRVVLRNSQLTHEDGALDVINEGELERHDLSGTDSSHLEVDRSIQLVIVASLQAAANILGFGLDHLHPSLVTEHDE
jgi:hypothetical protein